MAYCEHEGEKRQAPPENGASASWYARTNTSAARTLIVSGVSGESASAKFSERGIKFGLQFREPGRDQLASWNHYEIEPTSAHAIPVGRAEYSADPPFGAVAHDRAAETARRNDSQPINAAVIHEPQHRHVATCHTPAFLLDSDELCACAQPRLPAERLGHEHRARCALRGNR
jgi:hypothetical protein